MRWTEPTGTPRKVTGAPISRPATDPPKKMTARVVGSNRRERPNSKSTATASASPPSTKPPTAVGLTVAIRALPGVEEFGPLARHECAHDWMVAPIAQRSGRAMGDRRTRFRIQENAVVADRDQTRQLVADHDDRSA